MGGLFTTGSKQAHDTWTSKLLMEKKSEHHLDEKGPTFDSLCWELGTNRWMSEVFKLYVGFKATLEDLANRITTVTSKLMS